MVQLWPYEILLVYLYKSTFYISFSQDPVLGDEKLPSSNDYIYGRVSHHDSRDGENSGISLLSDHLKLDSQYQNTDQHHNQYHSLEDDPADRSANEKSEVFATIVHEGFVFC